MSAFKRFFSLIIVALLITLGAAAVPAQAATYPAYFAMQYRNSSGTVQNYIQIGGVGYADIQIENQSATARNVDVYVANTVPNNAMQFYFASITDLSGGAIANGCTITSPSHQTLHCYIYMPSGSQAAVFANVQANTNAPTCTNYCYSIWSQLSIQGTGPYGYTGYGVNLSYHT